MECERCPRMLRPPGKVKIRMVVPGTDETMAGLCMKCADEIMREAGIGEAVAGRMSWEAVNDGYDSWRVKAGLGPGEPLRAPDADPQGWHVCRMGYCYPAVPTKVQALKMMLRADIPLTIKTPLTGPITFHEITDPDDERLITMAPDSDVAFARDYLRKYPDSLIVLAVAPTEAPTLATIEAEAEATGGVVQLDIPNP